MTNRIKVEKEASKHNLEVSIYHSLIDSLSKKELDKVLANISSESDTDVVIKRKAYVVEIDIVEGGEVDLAIITKEEYINRYGNERYDNE